MFDDVYTPLGVVLIVFGLYLVVSNRNKAKSAEGGSNKVEAFGIKIDVSNPSVLLILLGVGLVLVPKFAPEPEPERQPIPAPTLATPQVPAAAEARPAVTESKPLAPAPAAPDEPVAAVTPPAPPPAMVVPVPQSKPPVPDVVVKSKPKPKSESKPKPKADDAVIPKVASDPAPRPAPSPASESAAPPKITPKLWVLVDAEVSEDAGMQSISAKTYSAQLREKLAGVAAALLGEAQISVAGDQAVAREGRQSVCAAAPAPKVLLAKVSVDEVYSFVESAHWPNLQLSAINCEDGRVQRSQKHRLTPHAQDVVFYEQDFMRLAEQFVASRSYFLQ